MDATAERAPSRTRTPLPACARALRYAHEHRKRFVDELKEFIRFPSISAQPRHARDTMRCAQWLAAHLRTIGLENARVVETRGAPIVYASRSSKRSGPTLLLYGHYDVQPVDPVSEWHSPPFEPRVMGEDIYGRGASDDKGQMFTHVKALEAYVRSGTSIPVSVKCLFEGEEEIGSPHLRDFVSRNKGALRANVAVISDMPMVAPDLPALGYAVRGALYLDLEVTGAKHDLHSGNFGGTVHNPLQALCEIVSKLHDSHGRIAIPGIYAHVREHGDAVRTSMELAGPSDAAVLKDAEASRGWGEEGYSLYERATVRPALTVNGITGGYQGVGSKGVIPARARAKISFRLVPDQDPKEIERLFRRHIARITPRTVRSIVRARSGTTAAVVDPQHPVMLAGARAYREAFGKAPVLMRCGGTIPAVSIFSEVLHVPTVLMGFALPNDRLHAPNEKFHLPNYFKGIATSIRFLNLLREGVTP